MDFEESLICREGKKSGQNTRSRAYLGETPNSLPSCRVSSALSCVRARAFYFLVIETIRSLGVGWVRIHEEKGSERLLPSFFAYHDFRTLVLLLFLALCSLLGESGYVLILPSLASLPTHAVCICVSRNLCSFILLSPIHLQLHHHFTTWLAGD